jgi:hypothetical protein
MADDDLTPDHQALFEEFQRQIERVGVNMLGVNERLHGHESTERQISDEESEVSFSIDVSGILATLRRLPDNAGTDAFVAAYNSEH